ncbi:septin [Starmerella bacillaris]|uniref:Septin n=1 Tax=Starmerella bacillaris TaxID=1247836 RepID=A0AAV5RFQ9_STABA|nr:septin [Starmerella bacillaris]
MSTLPSPTALAPMSVKSESFDSISDQSAHSHEASPEASASSIITPDVAPPTPQHTAPSVPNVPSIPSVPVVPTFTPTIIRRKLTSFVGFSNLPQQWHQKSIQQGFDFNLLVVGESGLGKSTLLNTMFEVPVHNLDTPHTYDSESIQIQTTNIELEESGVKLRLNVIDTPGFGDNINNLDSWKVIMEEIDQRFDQYFEAEENLSVGLSGTAKDPRVHACLFFIEPSGHTMKPLDVVTMKKLHKKVNLVPVIAKSDTLTEEELAQFKHAVLSELEAQEIDFFTPPTYLNDDEETKGEVSELISNIPFAVVGSTSLVVNKEGNAVLGREYPWGVIEVHNSEHNDFLKLRSLLISGHLEDLRDNTKKLYERYRSEKLLKLDVKQDDSVFSIPDPAVRQEEERRNHEERLAKMESEMRAVFQKKVTEKEAKLKSSEGELYSKHREIKEQLDRQRQELEQRKLQLQQQIQMEQERRARKNVVR